MERIYKKIDQTSIQDNTEALEALVKQGLEKIEPIQSEVPRWRELVAESNRQLADQGVVNKVLMDEMFAHLAAFRADPAR